MTPIARRAPHERAPATLRPIFLREGNAMVLRRATLLALLLSGLALLAAGVGRTPGQSPSTRVAAASTQGVPAFDHIFVIVMENHAYSEIIGDSVDAPY